MRILRVETPERSEEDKKDYVHTGVGTRVTDADTGEPLTGVERLSVDVSADSILKVVVHLPLRDLRLIGVARFSTILPDTGEVVEVASLTLRDGREVRLDDLISTEPGEETARIVTICDGRSRGYRRRRAGE